MNEYYAWRAGLCPHCGALVALMAAPYALEVFLRHAGHPTCPHAGSDTRSATIEDFEEYEQRHSAINELKDDAPWAK